MPLKVFLLPLLGGESDGQVARVACDLAKRHSGFVVGLFVRIDASAAMPMVGEGVSSGAIEQLSRSASREMDQQGLKARAALTTACEEFGLPLVEASTGPAAPAALWAEAVGPRDDIVAKEARLADVTLFSRATVRSDANSRIFEAALMGSGRAVMVVPDTPPPAIGSRIVLAWNGSQEGARALSAALPLILAADAVHIIGAGSGAEVQEAGLHAMRYLVRHGIQAVPEVVGDNGNEADGPALMAAAERLGADLVVMGAYGRSRFTEMVFGGVTRHALYEGGLPLLLVH